MSSVAGMIKQLVLGCSLLGLTSCGGGSSSSAPAPAAPPPPPPTVEAEKLPTPPAAPMGEDFHAENRGWFLAWSDEFDGTELDRTKWEVEESCWGGGNNERQCYTDRDRNIEVVNGLLWIQAYAETFTGPEFPQGWPDGRGNQITKSYTSGKVRTRELADWKYGRFSARIKLPTGQGTWPAFWMLPSDNIYGGWAASGEIDIMETVNLGATCTECAGGIGENRTHGTLHFGGEWPNNTSSGGTTTLPGDTDALNQYHVFTVEWGEGRFNWFIDGVKYHTIDSDDWTSGGVDKATHPFAPFDQDFYMMFNLAVGGNWPENANENRFDTGAFPNELLVDWVRVYQCNFDGTDGRDCMDGE